MNFIKQPFYGILVYWSKQYNSTTAGRGDGHVFINPIYMKRKILFGIISLVLFLGTQSFGSSNSKGTLTPALEEHMQSTKSGEFIRINITLSERFNEQPLLSEVRQMDRKQRKEYAVQALKEFAALSQEGILQELNILQQQQAVEQVTTFWIANVIHCFATPEAIDQLSGRTDVLSIDYDEIREVIDPAENKDAVAVQGMPGGKEITWNILKVNADDVWAIGFTGEGVVVSVIDTGVNYDHLDLADHMWESDEYPNHGWDFYYNDDDPMDEHGHGTHCAGTVAGDGTAGSQTGVAPDAQIMACKVGDALGNSSESMIWSAVEFSLEQGADVISISMGWQHDWGPNRVVWRETFESVLAAGVVASVAAGNEGDQQGTYPIPDNVRTPGDCPPPWLNPDQTVTGGTTGVICVGSTTISDNVSGFSSRGPVTWEDISPWNDYPYQPDIGLIRPDIGAPGSNIKSLAHYSNSGYEAGWSGTSMATPANAGMIALMLQKNENLTPEQISQIVEESAEVLVPGKNNNSGAGRIDALAAIEMTNYPGPSYYSHTINDESGNNDGLMNPGEEILLTMAIANFSEEVVEGVSATLSTESEFITITDDNEFFGDFGSEDILEIADAFAFEVATNIPGGVEVEFLVTAYNDDASWESTFSITAHAVNLVMTGYTIEDPTGNNNGGLDPGETADIHVETTNTGQLVATETLAELVSLDNLVTVNSGSVELGDLESGESAIATFNVTVNSAAPIGTAVDFMFEATAGLFNMETTFGTKIGAIVEDFETGDFSKFEWAFAGSQDWEISSDAYEGDWAAVSGDISDNQTSEIKLTYEVGSNDSIAFYRKVSSESSYDFLEFYIDNELMDEWAGELSWERFAYPVEEGEHTFRWVYDKDQSVSSGSDAAWIDYIELPVGPDLALSAFAGDDEEICEAEIFETNGFAQNYILLLWTSSGSGTFEDENELYTTYMPSDEDYEEGMVVLVLTVYASGVEPVTDFMELSFQPLPDSAGQVTGPTEVCNGTSEQYAVDAIEATDEYVWELVPAEAGTLVGDTNVITIDWAEDYIGEATLKVKGTNTCGDGEYSEDLVIMVDECSSIDDLYSGSFSIAPNPNSGTFTLEFSQQIESAITVRITNTDGTTVFSDRLSGGNNVRIQTENLKSGLYFIIVENEAMRQVDKLIIRE